MTNREKIVELLEQLDAVSYEKSKTETGFMIIKHGKEYIADYLLSHGVTVRGMQKPLTVEELKRMEGSPVWCETEATKTPCVVKNSMIDKVDAIFYALGSEYPIFFNVDGYGQTWRCWAEKPTEEERKVAEWE